jgi:hypothetical protein
VRVVSEQPPSSAFGYYDYALSCQASGQQLVTSNKYDLADQAFQKASVNFQQAEYKQDTLISQLKNSLNPSNDIGDAYRFYGEIILAQSKLAKIRSELYTTQRETIEEKWKENKKGQDQLNEAKLELEKAEAKLLLAEANRNNLSKYATEATRKKFNAAVLIALQARGQADGKVKRANKPHTEMIFKQAKTHLDNSHKYLLKAQCQFEEAISYYKKIDNHKFNDVKNQLYTVNSEIAIKKLKDYIAIRTAEMKSDYGIFNFFVSITTGNDANTKISAALQIIEKLENPTATVELNKNQFDALHEKRLGVVFAEVSKLCPNLRIEEPSSCFSFFNC